MRRVSSAPRALVALEVYDRWGVHLCDECEGRLLCVLPPVARPPISAGRTVGWLAVGVGPTSLRTTS